MTTTEQITAAPTSATTPDPVTAAPAAQPDVPLRIGGDVARRLLRSARWQQ